MRKRSTSSVNLSEVLESRRLFSVGAGDGYLPGETGGGDAAITSDPTSDELFQNTAVTPSGAVLKKGTLTITGTTGNDTVTVTANKTTNQLTVVLNGNSQTFSAAGLKAVKVNAGTGNDTVTLNVATADAASLYGRVTVDGGAGNDTLTSNVSANLIGGAGNDTLSGSTGNDQLRGDAGDDIIRSNGGRDSISAGIGNNTVRYANGIDFDVNGASVRLEKGGQLVVRGTRGNDTAELATNVGNNLRVSIGGQQSDIALGTVKGIRVIMGSGNDEVRLSNYNPTRLTLTKPASIDGGIGTDTIRGKANSNQILAGRFEATPAT